MTDQIWLNDRGPIPAWVSLFVSEGRQPNGTFLIKTPLGHARVHVGNIVLLRTGRAYTYPAREAREHMHLLGDASASPRVKRFNRPSVSTEGGIG